MIPALIRAQYYSDKIVVTLGTKVQGFLPTAREQLGKAHSVLSISWQTSVEEPLSSLVLSEQEESAFQQNLSLLTAENWISTRIQPPHRHPAAGSIKLCPCLGMQKE